jgi:hypothetical protein
MSHWMLTGFRIGWWRQARPVQVSVRIAAVVQRQTASQCLNRDRQCIKGTVLWGLQEADKGLRVEPL